MNKKVAKLVTVSFMTRVVVNENATNEEILNAARPKFAEKVATELGENLEEIVDDEECPFGVFLGDFYPAYIYEIINSPQETNSPSKEYLFYPDINS